MERWNRNLRLVLWIRILFALIFSLPVISLYWQTHGMDLADVFWLQAIFAVAIIILEVPTGYIGDRIGRKKTLILACAMASIGWSIYAIADSFIWFVLLEIILGCGFAFLSGTDTALVFESLQASGRAAEVTRVSGRQLSLSHWAEGAAALSGGLAASVLSTECLLVASGLATLIALGLALGITDPPRESYSHPRGTLYGIYKIARFAFLRSSMVRYVLPFMSVCSLATMLGVWLYQPLWQASGVPLWLFGVLWAALSFPTGLAGHWAHHLEQKLGTRRLIMLMPLFPITGYLLMAVLPGWTALCAVYLVPVLRGLAHPVLARFVHEETWSDKRATVFSLESWLFRLLYFTFGPVVGYAARDWSLDAAFALSAGIVLVLSLPLMLRLLAALRRHKGG